MRITDLLDKRSISLDAAPKSKEEALNDAVALMEAAGRLNDVEGYRRQVFAREKKVQRALVKELQSRMVNAVQ